jgi:hypothetical protein
LNKHNRPVIFCKKNEKLEISSLFRRLMVVDDSIDSEQERDFE